jgi:hypothetical protein
VGSAPAPPVPSYDGPRRPTPTRRPPAPEPDKGRKTVGGVIGQPFKVFSKAQNDIGSISLPKFTSDTGAVVMLVALNMGWSLLRTLTEHADDDPDKGAAGSQHGQLVKIVAGTWVVGLGVLIVHAFDPHVAMLFALLFVIGNVLSDNAGNTAVINAFDRVFVGGK